jgi:two-component system phosphate regulon sensor histidine kinase PhoR
VAENHAREAVTGERGPWDFEAAHFKRLLRMRAVNLGRDGVVLFFDDITELRRLESMRADFVANLAHEMRTPVASLSLAAETLTTDLPAREQRRFIERIAEETQYIAGLLRSVSELALLESAVELSLSTFVLRDVVSETWRRVTDRQGTGDLSNEVPEQLLVTADRVRVAEVLQNLLENAHRFSQGSPVQAGARGTDAVVEVWVADSGPGIPPAELSRIFERFYKVDRARTRRGDGSGLGLAIAKHLVSAHNGQILASAAESGGTRITFTLPLRKFPLETDESPGTASAEAVPGRQLEV